METHNKVLIIDDEPNLVEMVKFQFRAHGYVVECAYDGLSGLEAAHRFQPNLIILDINMPRMGGIEFYSKICGSNGKPLFPVLVLTARANIQNLFQDLQIDGFMIKPFEVDHLIREAGLIIRKKMQQQPGGPKAGRTLVARKVCIADNQPHTFWDMSKMFLEADFSVIPATKGAQAIEKMMVDVPDAAVFYLGLDDIPGDIAIFRLSQMAKTRDVKFVLCTPKDVKHDEQVMHRIRSKTGIYTFIEYDHKYEVLDAVKKAMI